MKINKKFLAFFIIFGLILRFTISASNYYGDIDLFFLPWANDIIKFGFSGFYERNILTANYPPLTLICFAIELYLYKTVFLPINSLLWFLNLNIPLFPSQLVHIWQNRNTVATFIKGASIFADIFLAIGLFKIASLMTKNKKIILIIFLSALFNPAIIYNSSLWGQIDTIPLAFLVWSIYLIYTKKYLISSFLLFLGLLSKQTIGIILPIYAFMFWKYFSKKNKIGAFVLGLFIFFIVFIPFSSKGDNLLFPYLTYLNLATKFGSSWLSAHAFNIWYLVFSPANISDTFLLFGRLTPRILSSMLVIINTAFVLFIFWKRKLKLEQTIFSITLVTMFMFLFSTRMHERHLLPTLPFLLLLSAINVRYYWLFLYATFFHLLNLYASWGQPRNNFIFDLTTNRIFVNLIIVIQILIYFVIFYYFVVFSTKNNLSKLKTRLIKD